MKKLFLIAWLTVCFYHVAVGQIKTQSTCCPPWDKSTLAKSFSYEPLNNGMDTKYVLKFNPNTALVSQLNAYIAYLHSLNPSVNKLCLYGRIHCYGTGTNAAGTGPSSPNPVSTNTCNGTQGIDVVPPFWLCFSYPANTQVYPVNLFPNNVSLCPNVWYCIYTETGNDPGPNMFDKECVGHKIYFRWSMNEVQRTTDASAGSIQISDGNQLIGQPVEAIRVDPKDETKPKPKGPKIKFIRPNW